jgi:two-component system, cell cycle sensor histidine kinase and response regulator CckA
MNGDDLLRSVKGGTAPARLLLVEDNPGEARLLQLQLERRDPKGFVLIHVTRLSDALRLAVELPVDIILLDLGLPDCQGLETLVRLQTVAPHVPTIVLTATDDDALATRAVRAGAQDYVVKGRTADGQLERVIRYAIERKRIEGELRKLTRAVEQSPVSVVITDTAGTIEYVNPRFEQVSGYGRMEVLGKNPRLLKSGQTPAEVYREMWQTILAGREWRGEVCNRRKNGEHYWEAVSISPVRNQVGAVTHFVGFKEDITERKAIDTQSLRAQKMESIQAVLGGIAQNFNNILNNVLGFALLVKKYAGDATKVTRYGDVIEQSVSRGAKLTERLLALTRTPEEKMQAAAVEEIVREALTQLQGETARGVSVRAEIAPGLGRILADRHALSGALVHLLRNAVESTLEKGEGGSVWITAGRVGSDDASFPFPPEVREKAWVSIQVEDQGPGIPAEIRDRVFEPLFTTKGSAGHAGLGLALVYNTVRRHRGAVTVDSEPGQRTVFHVYLPCHVAAPEEASSPEVAGKGELILLVDDEPAMREFGSEILEEYGYRVLLANNGEEALQVFKDRPGAIDLVVLDLVMPGMDGGQTFLEMKKIRDDVKAFFCTGFTSDHVITGLFEEERLKAIKKPFKAMDFLAMVRQVIDER